MSRSNDKYSPRRIIQTVNITPKEKFKTQIQPYIFQEFKSNRKVPSLNLNINSQNINNKLTLKYMNYLYQ